MDYHDKFEHKKIDVQCKCGQKQSQLHPFSCLHIRLYRAKLFSLIDKRPFSPDKILGIVKEIKLFAEWAQKTELFWNNKGHNKLAGL